MKNKFLIFGFCFLAGLLFSLPALAYTYSRTPSGYTIYNPVNFFVEAESYEQMKAELCWSIDFTQWRVVARGVDLGLTYSESVPSSTLSHNFLLNLPVKTYLEVWFQCFIGEGGDDGWWQEYLESLPFSEPIFEIVEAPAPPPAVGYFPSDFATNTLAYIGYLISDLSVPIYILIGFMLAVWLIDYLLGLFTQKRKEK
jgi:hypothetical protein